MSIYDTVNVRIKEAMKAKEVLTVSTLRLTKDAFDKYLLEKKKTTLDDAEAVTLLQKLVKQRRESVESYEKAGRKDLAQKETDEIQILAGYLPKQMSDDEIKALAQKAIQASGATSKADAGKVMKELMPAVQGKADGKKVSAIVASLLP